MPRGCEHNATKKCRDCKNAQNRAYMKARRDANLELFRDRARRYYHCVKDERQPQWNAYHRARSKRVLSIPELAAKSRCRSAKKQGTPWAGGEQEIVAQALAAWNLCCEGCDKNLTMTEARVDHDHSTGLFRGILCDRCNFSLGLTDDSSNRLRTLADYAERKNTLAA